jgi:hypothetical protein
LDALGGALAVVGADRFGTVPIESTERVCPQLESLYAFRGPRATLSAPVAPNQCKGSSLLIIRLHRPDFYVVLRKLIAELQAFSKRIQETTMVRFYSSIYANDKMLIRQMSCDSAFHRIPHQIAAAHRTKTECLGSVPDHMKHNPIRVRNSLFLVRRHDI